MKKLATCLFSLLFIINSNQTLACSRILISQPKAVMVGRNMDWSEDMNSSFIVYPAGISKSSVEKNNPIKWVSKYGSIVTANYEDITTDGMNEMGLAAHILVLNETAYAPRDASLPGLSVIDWTQFYLDNFKSVAEAINFTTSTNYQLTSFYHATTHHEVKLHLAIEDASGDSAIIEFINGKPVVYHDRSYIAVTNSPTYDVQLKNLKQYKGFGGSKYLPGSTSPADRFVRASFYGKELKKADSAAKELSQVFSIINNVSEPMNEPSENISFIAPTLWSTVADLTNRIYYFHSMNKMTLVSAKLSKFNLRPGAPVMRFDLDKYPQGQGDVSKMFVKG